MRWWPWAAAGAALAAVFEVYGPALNGAYVLDDLYLPFVGNSRQNLWHVLRLRPLLMASFWADYRLAGGGDPWLFHATNVLLHFGVAVMAALIAAKLLEWTGVEGRMRAALAIFSGGLFLLHPVQTESVAYVASRSENLSVLLYYAGFAVFLYRPGAVITWPRALAILALFAGAISSKEHALTLPVLLIFADYFWKRGGVRAHAKLYALLAAAGAAGAVLVWRVVRAANTAGFHLAGLDPISYLFTQFRVIWIYIRLFFLPIGQNVDPDVPVSHGILDHGAIFGLIALAGLVAAGWIWRKRFPLASFGIFMFLLLLAPTSSVVPIQDVEAEHRLYLPFLGLALVCLEVLRRWKVSQTVWTGAAVLAACCVLTYQRSAVWASPLDLWTDSAAKSPEKYRPRFQLAFAEYQENKCADASKNFEIASHFEKPDNVLLTDWALALDCAGQWPEAIAKLTAAEGFRNDAHVHTQLAMVYAKHDQMPAATEELDRAAKLDASYDMIYVYRGDIDLKAGDRAAAEREFRHALTLNPSNQAALDGLAGTAGR